jgi:hypothetical protein
MIANDDHKADSLRDGLAAIGRLLGIEALRAELADLRAEFRDLAKSQGRDYQDLRRIDERLDELLRRRTR